MSSKLASVSASVTGTMPLNNMSLETTCTGEAAVGVGVKGGVSVNQNKIKVAFGAGMGAMTSGGCEVVVTDNRIVSKEERQESLLEHINKEGDNQ